MMQILNLIPHAVLVWMIGFSGDPRWLRIGGFAVLVIKWVMPPLTFLLMKDSGNAQLSNSSNLQNFATALLLGGYLIFWAVRSTQRVGARLLLGVAGLIALGPVLVMGLLWIAMG
jgi:hypothetical protein